MFNKLKRAFRPFEVMSFVYKSGFYLKKIEGCLYLCKKGNEKKIAIKNGNLLSIYRQIRDFARLFDYFIKKNITVMEDKFYISDVNGIDMYIKREKDDEYTIPTMFFYFTESIKDFEEPSAELVGYTKKRDIEPNDIVFDCGAFHGWFSIYAAKKAKNGHVYCFEPDTPNIKILRENIELNNLKNVTVVPEVLAEKTGFVSFYETGTVSSKIVESGDKFGSNTVVKKLPSVSIKDFCLREKIKTVNFIKMDVEGAECEIVKGSNTFIENNVEFFAIASYHIISEAPSSKILEPLFSSIGFQVETAYPRHQTTYAWKAIPKK
ncbi:MAG: FkbM family methyltransferase [Candidatus Micrarchaeota archaeon]|nr:FkbM family methyltransferase [Candidatus Micrarchaeota archaeon]